MSAKKRSEVSSVVVGSGKKNRVGPHARLIALVLAGVVVLAAVAFGGYAAYNHFTHKENKSSGDKTQTQKPNYVSKGMAPPTTTDYSGDQAALDKDIQNAPDDAAKATLYLRKADVALVNKGFTDEALGYAQKAEELSPSIQSAFELATIYQGMNKKTEAIKYYTLYLSRMTPEYKQTHPGDYEHYQQVLQELQKQ